LSRLDPQRRHDNMALRGFALISGHLGEGLLRTPCLAEPDQGVQQERPHSRRNRVTGNDQLG